MSIEFIKEYPNMFQVERHDKSPTATSKTNIGYIFRRKYGSIHFCGYEIDELEQILAKMKEIQEGKC